MTTLKDTDYLTCSVDTFSVASLSLNRPDKHNAFNAQVIEQLIESINSLAQRSDVRCLVLRGNGKHFSAGADLGWMQSMADKSEHENQEDASRLAQLMRCLDNFPHPTLAVVHGCAFGGALGLICCCDVAIADHSALFCLSEVKLGLVPATIGPYVNRAIGARQSRRYMLTAERFDANKAVEIGLIHEAVEASELEKAVTEMVNQLQLNSPAALTQTKALIRECDSQALDDALIEYTSQLIAKVRVSEQGQEGLRAFFDKRPPNWAMGGRE
ncbi:enoyl-CoA hydratase/isomerase family protein [Vibrio coralliilyticus]|uniref:enoyl-CoA hydratase/isomerase family protein n=1 Tax=Vibrio coralliilyticus TaxID=190893 RepID=UPI0006CC7B4E|nr:enoyl-CoA hydratase/isomerase family protein [Vibrio coralliilyticus]AXN33204.1 enoyl-CoA hydratase/isomerase family protein [Vibrio coralliilyticus]KPH23676.1 gamma-carboxygeranoyl-CoA hydratase [Vibrio coralliilyticus]